MPTKRKKKVNQIELLNSEYVSITPIADRFCTELNHQISELLRVEQISLGMPIEYRVKQWQSFVSKIERLSLNISSVKELNDLVGLRLILLFNRDLLKVCEILGNTFKVVDRYNTQERLKEDQFGYSSVHFIIELPESWLSIPTMTQLKGLKAEIQVRTVAQHIWAAASHVLQYKQESNVPLPVRRAISRVSALLETVDLEFERVLEQREAYRQELSTSNTSNQLDVDVFELILSEMLPAINKLEGEPYSGILSALFYFKIDTQQKLRELIQKHLRNVLKEDEFYAKRGLADPESLKAHWPNMDLSRLERGAYFSQSALVNRMLRLEVGEDAWLAYSQRFKKKHSLAK